MLSKSSYCELSLLRSMLALFNFMMSFLFEISSSSANLHLAVRGSVWFATLSRGPVWERCFGVQFLR